MLFTTVSWVYAQTGRIGGKVLDKKTGEALMALTVKVEGSTKGTLTDLEGRYLLSGFSAGKYKLTFSYVGYQVKTISDVIVKPGEVTSLDVAMEETTGQQLDQVVITASARQESVGGLYAHQKTNINISDGISAEQIRKSPDKNTSEVLKRVSGTSIQDNKFVIIRGLSDRYNTTLLNNAVLPSTETDKKAFSFDIIPSNMIDNVIINKTASPEYPGDFSGGIVQVITKDIPDQNYFIFSAGTGYNSETSFKDFSLGERGKLEFLAISDKSRKIPAGIPSSAVFMQTYTDEQKVQAGKLFDNSFKYNTGTAVLPYNFQANLGLTKRFENNSRLGAIVALTYRTSETYYKAFRYDYEDELQYEFGDGNNKSSTALGGLFNLAYINGTNKIALKTVYNRSIENSFIHRTGIQFINTDSVRGYSFDLVTKSLMNAQLEGKHKLDFKSMDINWNVNYSYSDRDQPDLKSLNYMNDYDNTNANARQFIAVVPSTVSRTDASRFFSGMHEHSIGGGLSGLLPTTLFNEKANLKAGLFKQFKKRDFEARKFGYVKAEVNRETPLVLLPYDKIFAHENMNLEGFLLDEGTEFADTYDATSDLNAGYVQVENKFGGRTRAVWGLRVEQSNQLVKTFNTSGLKENVKLNYVDFLPSLNLTHELNEKMNLRFSASQTVTRPELRELANFGFFDYVSKKILLGNPELKRSQNTNLDLKYEIYPGNGQIASVSGFFKHFKNPIEQIVSSGSVKNISFANANSATSYGMELEFRKRLGFLFDDSKVFDNLIAYANTSIIFSTVNLNSLTSEVTSRALQGQSPYIINGGVQYSSSDNDFSANLLYNRIGQRISEVGYQGYPDIYEKGRNVLDIQFSKKVLSKKAELRLNLSDLLNEKIIFYQNRDKSKLYDADKDRLMNSARMGYGASLSFTYNFSI